MRVVLLPGMDGSGELFAGFVSELRTASAVVSYPADRPLGYDELKELVRASLPRDEPFILLAESFSGPIAIALAAEGLPQLRAVVLVCTFARLPGWPIGSVLSRLVARVPVWRAPTALAARVLLGRFRSPEIEAELRRATQRVSAEAWRARIRGALTVDETSVLSRIRVPLLYLRASEDTVVFSAASKVISEGAPQAKVVEIEGPHFLLQARPAESAAAVRAFVSEHGLGTSGWNE